MASYWVSERTTPSVQAELSHSHRNSQVESGVIVVRPRSTAIAFASSASLSTTDPGIRKEDCPNTATAPRVEVATLGEVGQHGLHAVVVPGDRAVTRNVPLHILGKQLADRMSLTARAEGSERRVRAIEHT